MIYGFGDCLRFRILLLVCACAVNSVGMVVLVILGCISLLFYLYLPISGLCRLWLFGDCCFGVVLLVLVYCSICFVCGLIWVVCFVCDCCCLFCCVLGFRWWFACC